MRNFEDGIVMLTALEVKETEMHIYYVMQLEGGQAMIQMENFMLQFHCP